jgi:hypothetical protein
MAGTCYPTSTAAPNVLLSVHLRIASRPAKEKPRCPHLMGPRGRGLSGGSATWDLKRSTPSHRDRTPKAGSESRMCLDTGSDRDARFDWVLRDFNNTKAPAGKDHRGFKCIRKEVSRQRSLAESLSYAKEPAADLATRIRDGYTAWRRKTKETVMSWATPTLVEICVGLEGTSKNSCFTRACANLMREILIRGGDDGSAGIFRCR